MQDADLTGVGCVPVQRCATVVFPVAGLLSRRHDVLVCHSVLPPSRPMAVLNLI